jgi:hypothetical protein
MSDNVVSIEDAKTKEVDQVKVLAIEKVPNGYLIRAGQGEVISVHLSKVNVLKEVSKLLA